MAPSREQNTDEGEVPDPNVDIRQTQLWLSVDDPSILSVAETVIINNQNQVAVLLQKVLRMLSELSIQQGTSSRRSSISNGSGSRRSSIYRGDEAVEEPPTLTAGEQAYTTIVNEQQDVFYEIFERFLLSAKLSLLVTRSKNLGASASAFVQAAKTELSEELIEVVETLTEASTMDLYVLLSKRHRDERKKGKANAACDNDDQQRVVQTRSASFRTNVQSDRDDSQSTEANTPRKPSAGRSIPKTPRGKKNGKGPADVESD